MDECTELAVEIKDSVQLHQLVDPCSSHSFLAPSLALLAAFSRVLCRLLLGVIVLQYPRI